MLREVAYEKASTQTVKLMLEPVLFDEKSQQVELLIDEEDSTTSGGEELLDAAD